MAEARTAAGPGVRGCAILSLMTAAFTWGLFSWYFALRALLLGGTCGTKYGAPACESGTGWNIWFLVVLTPAVCVAISVLNMEIFGPERRGHEFYRVALIALPVVGLVDIAMHSAEFGFSVWQLLYAVPCLALIVVVLVWTMRTIGLRGSFWLMSSERMSALGIDPEARDLPTVQSLTLLLSNGLGAAGGYALARWISELVG